MAVVHSRLVLCDVGKHTLVLNVLRTVGDVSDHVCAHDHLYVSRGGVWCVLCVVCVVCGVCECVVGEECVWDYKNWSSYMHAH